MIDVDDFQARWLRNQERLGMQERTTQGFADALLKALPNKLEQALLTRRANLSSVVDIFASVKAFLKETYQGHSGTAFLQFRRDFAERYTTGPQMTQPGYGRQPNRFTLSNHPSLPAPSSRRQCQSEKSCFTCNTFGHIARDCPLQCPLLSPRTTQ